MITPPIPAPEGEVPPRVWIRPQPPYKEGVLFAGTDADYEKVLPSCREGLIPYVPEAALSAEKQRGLRAVEGARAEEKAKAVAHVNAVQCLLAGRLPRGESWQFLTDAWNLNARFLCGENSDTQTEYLRQSRAAKEPS